jgi:hypothetical protein
MSHMLIHLLVVNQFRKKHLLLGTCVIFNLSILSVADICIL